MRLFLLATGVTVSCLIVASAACSSSDSSTDSDGGANLGDADLSTGDGGNKDKQAAAEAGACLGTTGAAPTCSGACAKECQNAVTNFDSDVAANLVTCVTGRVTTSATDDDCTGAAPGCVDVAVGAACTDDSAAAFCTTFLSNCPDSLDAGVPSDETQDDCVTFARGMTEDGRTALQNCVTEETDSCAGCLTRLRSLTLGSSH